MPVISSLVVTPVALLLGIASGGAGHGDYFAAMLLFPYTMLSAAAFGYISLPFILLAVGQFPACGIALGRANEKGRIGRAAFILVAARLIPGLAALVVAETRPPAGGQRVDALLVDQQPLGRLDERQLAAGS